MVVIAALLLGKMRMPDLRVGDQLLSVAPATNLLDALLAAQIRVPYSCRAGSCHACMVQCLNGELSDAKPDALNVERRQQGWRLACQCQVVGDVQIALFNPRTDGAPAKVYSCDWLTTRVLRLRLTPEQRLNYRAGQHLMLWSANGIARPYSLASLPDEDAWLEFHIDCQHSGAFTDLARQFKPGDAVRLGELRGGALHYDSDWHTRALWLLASGTGLAPLYGVLREALRHHHQGAINVVHLAHDPAQHYLTEPLQAMAAAHPQLQVQCVTAAELPAALAGLRLVSRQTQALLCGHPEAVAEFTRRLYLAGVPRNQVLADLFVPHAC